VPSTGLGNSGRGRGSEMTRSDTPDVCAMDVSSLRALRTSRPPLHILLDFLVRSADPISWVMLLVVHRSFDDFDARLDPVLALVLHHVGRDGGEEQKYEHEHR